MHYAETKYGFEYGPAKVQRLFSDGDKGWVTIGVDTDKASIQIHVSATGKVTVYLRGQSSAKSGGGK